MKIKVNVNNLNYFSKLYLKKFHFFSNAIFFMYEFKVNKLYFINLTIF